MSALFLYMTIDWVMRQTTSDQPRGIRWTLFSTLEDLDFADEVAMVLRTRQHMQEKNTRLSMLAQQGGLRISVEEKKVMMLNVPNPSPVKVNGEDLPTTEEFTYLCSTVRLDDGVGSDFRNRFNKARNAFRPNAKQRVEVIPVQHQDQAKTAPQLRTFHPTIRRMVESDHNKLSTFHNKNLRGIQRTFLPETISNQDGMGTIIMRRRWRWIGHVMRLYREPGHRGKAETMATQENLRPTVEGELKTLHHTWGTVQKLAQNRQEWGTFVAALHASRHNGHE